MVPVAFEVAFLTAWPSGTEFQVLAYTGEVSAARLLDGSDNTTPAPPLDVARADLALTERGYRRTGDWSYTDDVWAAVIDKQDPAR